MINVEAEIDAFDNGDITFDELKSRFEAATFTVRRATRGDWGDVWARAEEPFDPADAPSNVYAATTAGQITKDQAEELLAIYRRKVTPPE